MVLRVVALSLVPLAALYRRRRPAEIASKPEELTPLRQRFQPPNDKKLRAILKELLEETATPKEETPPAQIRAGGYIRVSTTMQAVEGESLEDQAERIRNHICNEGWTEVEVFTEAATGRNGRRKAFKRLKRRIKKGRLDVFIVDRLDRIARHLPTFLEFINLLREHDVQLVSLREQIDYRQPWGKLVLYILGALAEFYSDILSEEMRIKRLMDAKEGKLAPTYRLGYCKGDCSTCTDPNGKGYCPYYGGPDRKQGRFRILHPVESAAVRLMFNLYATGRFSFADIARRLNEEIFTLEDGTEVRFRTKGRPGYSSPDRFDADAVGYIVSNPIYAGFVTYAGSTKEGEKFRKPRELFPGNHTPVVDLETFQIAQQIRKGRFNRSQADTNRTRAYPLARVLSCAHRHGTVRSISSGKYRYYRDIVCQHKYGEKHQPTLRAAPLEEKVRQVVGEMEIPAAWLRQILAIMVYDEDTDALVYAQTRLRERLEAEAYLLRQGIISQAQYNERRTALEAELAALAPESAAVSQEAVALLDNFPAFLAALEPEEENLLYRSIFSAIIVKGDEIVAWEVYPPFADLHPNFTLPGTHEPLLGYREPPQHPA
jgi:DNA invertase Pin-like site-specific DNA recombinase